MARWLTAHIPVPLIGSDQDFALWALLLAMAAFGFWCERFPWGRKYSGVMIVITLGIVLSNLRLIPSTAPVYSTVWNYLVPAAIPLLLFRADIRRIVRESGPTLIAFIIGAAGVVAGTLIGIRLLDLGRFTPELAGVFTGTYIGGSLNFAGVAKAADFNQPALMGAAVAADNVITNLHFLIILALPGMLWLTRYFPTSHMDGAANDGGGEAAAETAPHHIERLDIAGLLLALGLSFGLCALGYAIAGGLGYPQYAILIITGLALLVPLVAPRLIARLSGDFEAGNVLMMIFFASIGASADLWVLVKTAPILFGFAALIIVVHLVILFAIGKVLRIDVAELAVASVAAIGGPGSAAALASVKGWRALVTPGVLTGSLGYAIGTFIGIAVVEMLR